MKHIAKSQPLRLKAHSIGCFPSARSYMQTTLTTHCVVCIIFMCSAFAVQAREFTYPEQLFPGLADLLRAAATQSARVEVQQAMVEERAGWLEEARATRRPRIGMNMRVAANYEAREDDVTKTNTLVDGNLSVSQPLWYWGELRSRVAIGELRVQAAEMELARSGVELLQQVRFHYLRWVLTHFQIQRLQQVIDLAESRVANQRELLTVGRSTEQVVLEMEVRVQENREFLAFLQREYRRLGSVLRQQTGLSGDLQRFLPDQPPDVVPMSLSDLEILRRSLQARDPNSFELARRELELEADLEQLHIINRRHFPKVDLVAGVFADTLEGFNQDERVLRGNFFAGVAVNWNIFDGWATRGMRMSNLARQRMQRSWIEETRGALSVEAERLLGELEFNIQQILTRDTRLQLMERRLQLLEQQRERELIPVVDQLELQLNFGDLSLQALEARIQYLLHLAQLANLFQPDPFQPLLSVR